MALSTKDYLNLSALAYIDFNKSLMGATIKELIERKAISEKNLDNPGLSALKDTSNPLRSYKLISFQPNTASGFAAVAFQAPDKKDKNGNVTEKGEIVFSFRGTEVSRDGGVDVKADVGIFMRDAYGTLSGHLDDARKFVYSVLNNPAYANRGYSFTGHSLGGAIASYMTYATNTDSTPGVGKATTFDAPSVSGVIEKKHNVQVNPRDYDNLVIDYVSESDIIGNYANDQQLGKTQYIQSRFYTDIKNISDYVFSLLYRDSPITMKERERRYRSSLENVGRNVSGREFLPSHSTGNFFDENNNIMPKKNSQTVNTSLAGAAVATLYVIAGSIEMIIEVTGGVVGDLLYYSYEGSVKFVNTTEKVIEGLAYYGAEGVEKFIDTSSFVIGGLAYHAADGTIKFVDTTGNLIADGVWGGYSFFRDWFSNSLKGIQDFFNSATAAPPVRVDPLIFDLDGDGIKTTSLDQSRTYFDLDSNGFAERTAWVDASDGLLVLDRNNDGQITSGQELFGDQTLLANGVRAASGFESLKEFDSNRDGRIDAKDEVYSKLKIWRDLNGDGISQAEELKGLSDYNIASISLSSTSSNASDVMNNIQRRVGNFIKTDGSGGVIGEYLLNRNTLESHDLLDGKITMSEDILALPDLPGAGNVSSLRVAMAKDTSGQLKKLVSDLVNADDAVNRNQLFTEAVYKWTGADIIDPKSRGNFIDARRLAVLEKFMGTDFAGSNGANPNENAAPLLNKAYRKLMNRLYASIAGNTFLKRLVSKIEYNVVAGTDVVVDLSKVKAEIDEKLAANPAAGRQILDDFLRVAYGSGLEDSESLKDFCAHYATESSETARIVYAVDRDAIIGSEKADSLYTSVASNLLLYGDAGDDTLSGRRGNDILIGGQGDDALYGSAGDDIYVFSKGDGVDYISDSGGIDTIQFCKGIRPGDVSIKRVARGDYYNLELSIKDSTDRIVVEDYFGHYYYSGFSETPQKKIDRVVFADGTVWTQDTIYQRMHNITGTNDKDDIHAYDDGDVMYHGLAGDDTLYGGKGNDKLYGDGGNDILAGRDGDDLIDGGTGNDYLLGDAGNDVLIGGEGNDEIKGGTGNDTYIFNRGDGVDTVEETDGFDKICLGEGITPDDVVARVSLVNSDEVSLELSLKGTGDKITVRRQFGTFSYSNGDVASPGAQIEQIIFTDGTVWNIDDIYRRAHVMSGTDGNDNFHAAGGSAVVYNGRSGDDYIAGTMGDDKLYGDDGDDTIYSGEGNDLLVGGRGNDIINGFRGDDTYVFNLGDGRDIIHDNYGFDILKFGEGIAPEDIIIKRVEKNSDYNLELSIKNSEDSVTVSNYFGSFSYFSGAVNSRGGAIDQVVFADGTVWTVDIIHEMIHNITGTDKDDTIRSYDDDSVEYHGLAGNDVLVGGRGNDKLYGDDGDDTISGGEGNDLLVGGRGNDELSGYRGDDTYIFNKGDGSDMISECGGTDTIKFGEGITPDDVDVKRVYKSGSDYGYALELSLKGTSDKIAVKNYFGYYSYSGFHKPSPEILIEKVVFADGTVWTQDTINSKVRNITGTEDSETIQAFDDDAVIYYGLGGNDNLYGSKSNDKLYGGTGNDRISGGEGDDLIVGGIGDDYLDGYYGNDTYIFNKGDGSDTVYDAEGNDDKIILGYNFQDIMFERFGDNLRLRMIGSSDSVTINSWYTNNSSQYKIETFKSATGSTITHTQIENLIQAMSSFQKDTGMTWEQALTTQPSQVQSIVQEYWTVPGV